MLRRRSNQILALSVAVLVAAVAGVQLGHSAVSEINPIHFRGAMPSPRAIDPRALQVSRDSWGSAYDWPRAAVARAEACGEDCDRRQARDAFALAPDETVRAQTSSGPYWRDATPTTELDPWTPGETGGRALSIERYMHYPVEEAPETAKPAGANVPPADGEVFAGE